MGGLADILCRPLGISLFNCGTFSPGNIVCQEPLQISLPSVLNVGTCLNTTLLFCEAGSTISDSTLRELLQAVGCILSVAPEGLQLDLVSSLVCPLVEILNSSLDEFTSLLPFRFLTRGITNAVGSLTNNLLGAVGNCNT
uniref:23 kDa family member n=1 Tax=Rhipicephalus zambeziensis TaxID=60191 RepID=A0A224Y0Q2_9ACAR